MRSWPISGIRNFCVNDDVSCRVNPISTFEILITAVHELLSTCECLTDAKEYKRTFLANCLALTGKLAGIPREDDRTKAYSDSEWLCVVISDDEIISFLWIWILTYFLWNVSTFGVGRTWQEFVTSLSICYPHTKSISNFCEHRDVQDFRRNLADSNIHDMMLCLEVHCR